MLRGKPFKFYMTKSMFLHLALVVLAVVSTKLMFWNQENIRKTNIKLVEASVRIDMVAMPKFTIKELKSMDLGSEGEVEPEPIIKAKPIDNSKGPEFLKKKKKKPNFMDMMKNLSKQKVSKQKKRKKKIKKGNDGISNNDRSDLSKLVLSGNKLSKGMALTGGSNAAAQEGFQLYVSKLPNFVRPRWNLPAYLMGKELRCRIRVYLAPSGKLLKAEIYESSGDADYDQRSLAAVQKSSPFPSLDKAYSNKGIKGEILLGFPL
jgi:TonB family protein